MKCYFFVRPSKPSTVEGDDFHGGGSKGVFLALRTLDIVDCLPKVISTPATDFSMVILDGLPLWSF